MAQPPIYEIDADGIIHTDALHWEGFPRILWETLSEVGYTRPPLYEVVSFWDQGVPYARMTATVLPHPEHPEWVDVGGIRNQAFRIPKNKRVSLSVQTSMRKVQQRSPRSH
jgi:hypothetical protein